MKEVIEFVEYSDKMWRAEKCPWCTGKLFMVKESSGAASAEYLCLGNCAKHTENKKS